MASHPTGTETRPLFSKIYNSNDQELTLEKRISAWAFRLGGLSAVSILLAVAGPFGTYEAGGFSERLLYWFVLLGVSIVMALWLKNLIDRYLSQFRFLTRESLVVLSMTALFTVFVQAWTEIAFPGMAGTAPGYLLLASEVLVICSALSMMKYWVPFLIASPQVQTEQPRLTRRLQQPFTGHILRLTVSGHKVQVVTSEGVFDVRMRFSDAVEELDGIKGFCTHRSHWVSQTAIDKVVIQNGRPLVVLHNEDQVPVSRKYQSNLEDAGYL